MPGRIFSSRRALTLLAVLAVVAGVAIGFRVFWPPAPADAEVAIFFPSTSVSAWPDFVEAIKLAAKERDLEVQCDEAGHACTVMTSPLPVRFQWYPAIGSYEIQQSVREACQKRQPPIAVVGANNTLMTEALGGAIRDCDQEGQSPLLLMTTATADELINLVPDRTFRFGFSNRYQAEAVVARLARMIEESPNPMDRSRPVRAVLVQVEDNPFSLDLARDFEEVLSADLGATFIDPPKSFAPRSDSTGTAHGWSLDTATGGTEEPSPAEIRLAKAMLDTLLENPEARPVIVLPAGGDLFGRLGRAWTAEVRRRSLTEDQKTFLSRLVFLSGDSLDYFDFAEAKRGQVPPLSTPGPVIFFCHGNPTDESLGPIADSRRPSVGLNRDVVRALLDAAPTLGRRPTAEALARSLTEWNADNANVFEGRERRQGGGAVVAEPDRASGQFRFQLPEEWRK